MTPGSRRTARALLALSVMLTVGAAILLLVAERGRWMPRWLAGVDRPAVPTAPSSPATPGVPPPVAPLPSPPLEEPLPVPPLPPPADEAGPQLLIPVDGVEPADLYPSFAEPRNMRPHEAIDIMAPQGTPVRAVADGRVVKLFTSEPGGLTIYQFDTDERVAYYYAHLDRYEAGVAEGLEVRRGDLIGYVGSTGNASDDAPHLHFAVLVLGPEKRWWEGQPIDPYPLLGGR